MRWKGKGTISRWCKREEDRALVLHSFEYFAVIMSSNILKLNNLWASSFSRWYEMSGRVRALRVQKKVKGMWFVCLCLRKATLQKQRGAACVVSSVPTFFILFDFLTIGGLLLQFLLHLLHHQFFSCIIPLHTKPLAIKGQPLQNGRLGCGGDGHGDVRCRSSEKFNSNCQQQIPGTFD